MLTGVLPENLRVLAAGWPEAYQFVMRCLRPRRVPASAAQTPPLSSVASSGWATTSATGTARAPVHSGLWAATNASGPSVSGAPTAALRTGAPSGTPAAVPPPSSRFNFSAESPTGASDVTTASTAPPPAAGAAAASPATTAAVADDDSDDACDPAPHGAGDANPRVEVGGAPSEHHANPVAVDVNQGDATCNPADGPVDPLAPRTDSTAGGPKVASAPTRRLKIPAFLPSDDPLLPNPNLGGGPTIVAPSAHAPHLPAIATTNAGNAPGGAASPATVPPPSLAMPMPGATPTSQAPPPSTGSARPPRPAPRSAAQAPTVNTPEWEYKRPSAAELLSDPFLTCWAADEDAGRTTADVRAAAAAKGVLLITGPNDPALRRATAMFAPLYVEYISSADGEPVPPVDPALAIAVLPTYSASAEVGNAAAAPAGAATAPSPSPPAAAQGAAAPVSPPTPPTAAVAAPAATVDAAAAAPAPAAATAVAPAPQVVIGDAGATAATAVAPAPQVVIGDAGATAAPAAAPSKAAAAATAPPSPLPSPPLTAAAAAAAPASQATGGGGASTLTRHPSHFPLNLKDTSFNSNLRESSGSASPNPASAANAAPAQQLKQQRGVSDDTPSSGVIRSSSSGIPRSSSSIKLASIGVPAASRDDAAAGGATPKAVALANAQAIASRRRTESNISTGALAIDSEAPPRRGAGGAALPTPPPSTRRSADAAASQAASSGDGAAAAAGVPRHRLQPHAVAESSASAPAAQPEPAHPPLPRNHHGGRGDPAQGDGGPRPHAGRAATSTSTSAEGSSHHHAAPHHHSLAAVGEQLKSLRAEVAALPAVVDDVRTLRHEVHSLYLMMEWLVSRAEGGTEWIEERRRRSRAHASAASASTSGRGGAALAGAGDRASGGGGRDAEGRRAGRIGQDEAPAETDARTQATRATSAEAPATRRPLAQQQQLVGSAPISGAQGTAADTAADAHRDVDTSVDRVRNVDGSAISASGSDIRSDGHPGPVVGEAMPMEAPRQSPQLPPSAANTGAAADASAPSDATAAAAATGASALTSPKTSAKRKTVSFAEGGPVTMTIASRATPPRRAADFGGSRKLKKGSHRTRAATAAAAAAAAAVPAAAGRARPSADGARPSADGAAASAPPTTRGDAAPAAREGGDQQSTSPTRKRDGQGAVPAAGWPPTPSSSSSEDDDEGGSASDDEDSSGNEEDDEEEEDASEDDTDDADEIGVVGSGWETSTKQVAVAPARDAGDTAATATAKDAAHKESPTARASTAAASGGSLALARASPTSSAAEAPASSAPPPPNLVDGHESVAAASTQRQVGDALAAGAAQPAGVPPAEVALSDALAHDEGAAAGAAVAAVTSTSAPPLPPDEAAAGAAATVVAAAVPASATARVMSVTAALHNNVSAAAYPTSAFASTIPSIEAVLAEMLVDDVGFASGWGTANAASMLAEPLPSPHGTPPAPPSAAFTATAAEHTAATSTGASESSGAGNPSLAHFLAASAAPPPDADPSLLLVWNRLRAELRRETGRAAKLGSKLLGEVEVARRKEREEALVEAAAEDARHAAKCLEFERQRAEIARVLGTLRARRGVGSGSGAELGVPPSAVDVGEPSLASVAEAAVAGGGDGAALAAAAVAPPPVTLRERESEKALARKEELLRAREAAEADEHETRMRTLVEGHEAAVRRLAGRERTVRETFAARLEKLHADHDAAIAHKVRESTAAVAAVAAIAAAVDGSGSTDGAGSTDFGAPSRAADDAAAAAAAPAVLRRTPSLQHTAAAAPQTAAATATHAPTATPSLSTPVMPSALAPPSPAFEPYPAGGGGQAPPTLIGAHGAVGGVHAPLPAAKGAAGPVTAINAAAAAAAGGGGDLNLPAQMHMQAPSLPPHHPFPHPTPHSALHHGSAAAALHVPVPLAASSAQLHDAAASAQATDVGAATRPSPRNGLPSHQAPPTTTAAATTTTAGGRSSGGMAGPQTAAPDLHPHALAGQVRVASSEVVGSGGGGADSSVYTLPPTHPAYAIFGAGPTPPSAASFSAASAAPHYFNHAPGVNLTVGGSHGMEGGRTTANSLQQQQQQQPFNPFGSSQLSSSQAQQQQQQQQHFAMASQHVPAPSQHSLHAYSSSLNRMAAAAATAGGAHSHTASQHSGSSATSRAPIPAVFGLSPTRPSSATPSQSSQLSQQQHARGAAASSALAFDSGSGAIGSPALLDLRGGAVSGVATGGPMRSGLSSRDDPAGHGAADAVAPAGFVQLPHPSHRLTAAAPAPSIGLGAAPPTAGAHGSAALESRMEAVGGDADALTFGSSDDVVPRRRGVDEGSALLSGFTPFD